MGLMVDHTWGVPVVHHGGDLTGFHSDMMWLPEQQVGAVILTTIVGLLIEKSPESEGRSETKDARRP